MKRRTSLELLQRSPLSIGLLLLSAAGFSLSCGTNSNPTAVGAAGSSAIGGAHAAGGAPAIGGASNVGGTSTAGGGASNGGGTHTTGGTAGGTAVSGATIGATCADNSACTGGGELCSTSAFGADSINPVASGSCVSLNCTPSGGAFPYGCAGDRGACVASGSGNVCLGRCTFGNGTAATGCTGSTTCHYLDFYTRIGTAIIGYGYCLGGCSGNIACPNGSTCQLETGSCVAAVRTFTKSVGSSCTVPTTECNCLVPTTGTASYCSTACLLGGSTCPTGYTCGAGLPTIDGSGALFSVNPSGVAGSCLKNCGADAECASIGSRCAPEPSGVNVCLPGPR